MAAKILTQRTLPEFAERLRRIPANARPKWGRMRPPELMPHLLVQVRMALEEIESPATSNPFTGTLMRWLVFYVLPWPKGKIKAPDYFLPGPAESVETAREQLIEAMQRFVGEVERDPDRRVQNPLFGAPTLRAWSRMIGMHFDHHLRQFGV